MGTNKNFNWTGSKEAEKSRILTKQEKSAKHKQSFDKFQTQKQKGKEFVKNLKTKKIPKMDMTLNENLKKAVKGTKKKVVAKSNKKLMSKVVKAFKNTPKQYVKGTKNVVKQVGKRLLGPIGAAITAYDVIKTVPKVSKATVKGLKKRAKSGNVNIGRKL